MNYSQVERRDTCCEISEFEDPHTRIVVLVSGSSEIGWSSPTLSYVSYKKCCIWPMLTYFPANQLNYS